MKPSWRSPTDDRPTQGRETQRKDGRPDERPSYRARSGPASLFLQTQARYDSDRGTACAASPREHALLAVGRRAWARSTGAEVPLAGTSQSDPESTLYRPCFIAPDEGGAMASCLSRSALQAICTPTATLDGGWPCPRLLLPVSFASAFVGNPVPIGVRAGKQDPAESRGPQWGNRGCHPAERAERADRGAVGFAPDSTRGGGVPSSEALQDEPTLAARISLGAGPDARTPRRAKSGAKVGMGEHRRTEPGSQIRLR